MQPDQLTVLACRKELFIAFQDIEVFFDAIGLGCLLDSGLFIMEGDAASGFGKNTEIGYLEQLIKKIQISDVLHLCVKAPDLAG